MKYYDVNRIRQFIDANKNSIDYAVVGMREDWHYTSKPVFEYGEYTEYFLRNCKDNKFNCAGIWGSLWATPVMKVAFKDGHHELIEVYWDDREVSAADKIERMKQFAKITGGMDEVEV